VARAEHTVVVERSPDEVFAYLTDLSEVTAWQSGSVEVREPEGSLGVGSTYVQVLKFLGKQIETTLEVVEFEPGRRFALKTRSGPIPFEVRHTLEPAGNGTRLKVTLEGEPGGFFKLAEGIVERNAQRQIEQDFATLKETVEARAPRGDSAETDTP
jgi:carbon monoxide dehydrogenase subunit G